MSLEKLFLHTFRTLVSKMFVLQSTENSANSTALFSSNEVCRNLLKIFSSLWNCTLKFLIVSGRLSSRGRGVRLPVVGVERRGEQGNKSFNKKT